MIKNTLSLIVSVLLMSPVMAHGVSFDQNAGTLRQEFKAEVQEKRVETRKAIAELKSTSSEGVAEKRAALKSDIETHRADLKERLAKIKDARKRQAVERIDKQLAELNSRRLDHYAAALGKLEKIMPRIEERANKVVTRGIDVSSVKTALTDAAKAIADAREAIKNQAAKVYNITVTTEEGLRAAVGEARKALHADLMKVQEAVKVARQAVQNAATTLAKLRDTKPVAPATTTPTQ